MTSEEKAKITDLKKCDFSEMHQYFKAQSEARKAMSKDEKQVGLSRHFLFLCDLLGKINLVYSFCFLENKRRERAHLAAVWFLHHGQPQGTHR